MDNQQRLDSQNGDNLSERICSVKIKDDGGEEEHSNPAADEDAPSKPSRTRSRSRSKLRAGYEEANDLFDDGKYSQAYKKFAIVFDGRKSSLGPDHVDTLEARNKMALALGNLLITV